MLHLILTLAACDDAADLQKTAKDAREWDAAKVRLDAEWSTLRALVDEA